MASNLIDYYDEDKWGEKILTKDEIFDREKISLKFIEQYGKKKGAFLDIGCGVGFFLDKLHQRRSDMKLSGVDYSPYNLKKARASKLQAEFKKCNIEEGIPYKDKSFDMVYVAEVIEHVVNPDQLAGECARLLKKGGHVIITTPNLAAWYNRILLTFGMMPMFYELSTVSPKVGAGILRRVKQGNIPVGHIRIFTIRALKDLLEAAGLEVVAVKGAHFAALPKIVRWVDDIFKLYPRFASGMVVVARKK